MRKGQGISINVIVIAAIALLILVILSTLVIRSTGDISEGTGCEQTGGSCIASNTYDPDDDLNEDGEADGACGPTMQRDLTKSCPSGPNNAAQICCRRI